MKRRSLLFLMMLLIPLNANAIVFDYPIPESSYVPGSFNNRSFYYDSIHLGEDILLAEKTPIRAISDGKIVQYEYHSGYATSNDGTSIVAVVEHTLDSTTTFQLEVGDTKTVSVDKVCSIYGHIRKSEEYDGSKLTWGVGQEIKKGEIIGYINDDAHNGDGSEHLHMGIRLGGHPNYWVYYGYENDSIAESNVANFASASEIIDKLRCSETPQDHTLARIEGQGTTYWIQNGIKYYIISPDIFSDMIGIPGWGHICDFPAEALSLFQNGIDGDGTDFIGTSATSNEILIKLINDPKVYLIENGERRWITTLDVFNSLGLNEDDIIIVSQKIIELFPEGDPISNDGQDINPPILHGLTFTPSAIDVRDGAQTVTVTFEVSDDLSGLDYGSFYFRGPQYGHTVSGYISSYYQTCPENNPDCGIYEATLTFEENIESGTWSLYNVYLRDKVTNTVYYNTNDLSDMGFPTTLEVTSSPDITGPILTSFAIDETTTLVDVSSSSGEVKFNLGVSDDISGFDYGYINCYSPYFSYGGSDYNTHYAHGYFYSSQLNENGEVNGVTVYVPQYSNPGTWTCNVSLYDQARNYTYYNNETLESSEPDGFGDGSASFEVTSATPDLTPPTLSNFQVEPEVINTINSQDSTVFTVEVTDDISGFNSCYIGTRSPSGGQYQNSSISYYSTVPGTNNQYYREKWYPQYSEFGEWNITYLQCRDKLNNYLYFNNDDLVAAGWPSVIKVEGFDNSSVGSGTIGSGGGIIESGDPDGNPDGILTLEVPAGALDSPTAISVTSIGRFEDVDLKIGVETGTGHVLAEYDFQPDGLVFNIPVTITINVDVTDLLQPERDRIGAFINTDTNGDGIDDTFVDIAASKTFTNNPDGSVTLTMTMEVSHFTSYAVILPNIEGDVTPPIVEVNVPTENAQIQDKVTLQALSVDVSQVVSANFTILVDDGTDGGQPIGLDEISASYNSSTDYWELEFETVSLNDGYYLVKASATDEYGNEGESELVHFVIRNWSVTELLPASKVLRAGRTVPVKFSINTEQGSGQNTGFVYNEELEVVIYDNEEEILQTSIFGIKATDYRIDMEAAHYITNFKTPKNPGSYWVEVYRAGLEPPFLIGSFEFTTTRK